MALQKHHKILIGSFTSVVIIFMIVSGILIYSLYVKQAVDYNSLDGKITDVQSKIGDLSESLLQTKQNLEAGLEQNKQELSSLKASASSDFSGVIENSIKSVVTIRTDSAQGTGFIITDDGYIVTNAHVLADSNGYLAKNIRAINSDSQTISATFIGFDDNFDLALIKISGNYNSIKLGNSDNIQIGEKVIAIGNPLGLQFSVSEGIISAVNREGSNGEKAYIQTDAALNPGNSGGPLINKQGEVIGINNFKISGGESLGFALESNYIKEVVNSISQQSMQKDLL